MRVRFPLLAPQGNDSIQMVELGLWVPKYVGSIPTVAAKIP